MSRIIRIGEPDASGFPDKLFRVTLEQKDYDNIMNGLLDPYAYITTAEKSQKGDILGLRLTAGEETEETAFAVGKGYHEENLEQSLFGRAVGECFAITRDGVDYTACVLSIKRRAIPPLTDEMAAEADFEGAKTAAELRTAVHDVVRIAAKNDRFYNVYSALKRKLLKEAELEIDEGDVGSRVEYLKTELNESVPAEAQEQYLMDYFKLSDPSGIPGKLRDMAREQITDSLFEAHFGADADLSLEAYERDIRKYVARGMDEDVVRADITREVFEKEMISAAADRRLAKCCEHRWQIIDEIKEW